MVYCIFTYREDEALLRMAVERIAEVDAQAKIYAVDDARAPMRGRVPRVTVVQTRYDRGGNLNGLPNLAGQLSVFRQLMRLEGADYLVKVDADVWVNELGRFADVLPVDGVPVADYLATENWEGCRPNGHFYRVSRWLVDRLIGLYEAKTRAGEWPRGWHWPEDQSVYRLACLTGLRMELIPHVSGFSVGQGDEAPGELDACVRAAVVHCGEPVEGQRVSRAHAALRMRVLRHEVARAGKL